MKKILILYSAGGLQVEKLQRYKKKETVNTLKESSAGKAK
jgi:hypothetical protein